MPFHCNLRHHGLQIVEPRQHRDTCTIWAASAFSSTTHNLALPFMPQMTLPPDFSSTTRGHLRRKQRGVFCGMPLYSYQWIMCCKIVKPRQDCLICTYRTSVARCTGSNSCLPLVSEPTFPPNLFVAAFCYLIRSQFGIFCRMPFFSKFRKHGLQIIESGEKNSTSAIWTATVSGNALCNDALPFMATLAYPPYFPIAL